MNPNLTPAAQQLLTKLQTTAEAGVWVSKVPDNADMVNELVAAKLAYIQQQNGKALYLRLTDK